MSSPCNRFQESLTSLADGALDPKEEGRLREHLEGCPACRRALETERATKALLRTRLGAVEPPVGLADRIRNRIAQEHAEAGPSWLSWGVAPSTARENRQRVRRFLPLPFGAAAALLSLLLVGKTIPEARVSPIAWWTIGLLWSGLFAASFAALLLVRPALARTARAALVGAMLAIPLAGLVPFPALASLAVQRLPVAESSPVFISLLILCATVYTGLPVLLGGLLMGVGDRRTWLRSGALYLALLAPAIYLQCMLLALAAVVVWVIGAAIGAFGSAPIGFWLYRRIAFVR